MATISKKNIQTLIANFVRNPKELESYSKHCLNILKNYIWLKENQQNYEVDSYSYFSNFIRYYGTNPFSLSCVFQHYDETVLSKIDNEKKVIIHSNVYYLNVIDDLVQNMQSLFKQNNLIEDKKESLKFNRLDFIVLVLKGDIDTKKEYTYSEIYNMVLNNEIIVLDNFTSKFSINQCEIKDTSLSDKILVSSKCCENLASSSKMIDNFYSFDSENDKKIWGVISEPFCNYLRTKLISFSEEREDYTFNINKDFYHTIEHLQNISNTLLKYYRKKKKPIPKSTDKTIKEIQLEICELKDNFEKTYITEIIDNDNISSKVLKKYIKNDNKKV